MSIYIAGSRDINTINFGWDDTALSAVTGSDDSTIRRSGSGHSRGGVDDGPAHDAGDDHGGHGADDPAGHVSGADSARDALEFHGNFAAGGNGRVNSIIDSDSRGEIVFAVLQADLAAGTAGQSPTQVAGTAFAGDDTMMGGSGNNVMYGWGGNNFLVAGSGATILMDSKGSDTLCGGSGLNLLVLGSGGGGADDKVSLALAGSGLNVFVVNDNNRFDAIFEFHRDRDILEVHRNANGSGIQSADDVLHHVIDDGHGNSFVDLGHGNMIGLVGVSASQLTAANFAVI